MFAAVTETHTIQSCLLPRALNMYFCLLAEHLSSKRCLRLSIFLMKTSSGSHSPHHKPANQPFLQGGCSFDWRLAFRNRDRLLMKGTSGAVEKGIEAGAWGWNPASWVCSPQRHDVPAMGARREFTSIDLGSQVLLHQGLPNPRGQCQEDPSSGKIVRGAGAEVRGVTT